MDAISASNVNLVVPHKVPPRLQGCSDDLIAGTNPADRPAEDLRFSYDIFAIGPRAQRVVTLQASWLDCREFARPSAETSWRAVARTLQDCKHREGDRARCSGAAGAQARQVYSFQNLSIGP